MVVSKIEDKSIKIVPHIQTVSTAGFAPHRLFVPLRTGLLKKWEFQIISIIKLNLQDMTVECVRSSSKNKPKHSCNIC